MEKNNYVEREVWRYLANPRIQNTIKKEVRRKVKYDFDDIFQEVLLILFNKLVKSSMTTFRNGKLSKCKRNDGYLHKIVDGASIDIMRKKRKKEEREIPSAMDWEVA